MENRFVRSELLLGREAMERLAKASVAVFGVGGVGGYAAEALARSGVGHFVLVDSDTVCPSNINRQIIATEATVGQYKVDVMKNRIREINPDAAVTVHKCFFLPETADLFDFSGYSYVIDAVDTVTAKIELVLCADRAGVPIISSMGAGNKLDPTAFEVADIYKTSVCPLARVMRRELKKRGIGHLKVVYSREESLHPVEALPEEASGEKTLHSAGPSSGKTGRRSVPGSVAFVPSVAGLILAGEVVKDIAFPGRAG